MSGTVYSVWHEEIPRVQVRDQSVPFQRFLTTKGLVDACYVDGLKAEGHEVVETKTTNWRVLDYKEAMVDVQWLRVTEKKDAVGTAESYLEFVRDIPDLQ